jgi:hypothetical protein
VAALKGDLVSPDQESSRLPRWERLTAMTDSLDRE